MQAFQEWQASGGGDKQEAIKDPVFHINVLSDMVKYLNSSLQSERQVLRTLRSEMHEKQLAWSSQREGLEGEVRALKLQLAAAQVKEAGLEKSLTDLKNVGGGLEQELVAQN